MNPDLIQSLAMILGPLIGAGAGSYWGLKGAINGIRERSIRMEGTLGEVRDNTRDTKNLLVEYTREGRLAIRQIGRLYEDGVK